MIAANHDPSRSEDEAMESAVLGAILARPSLIAEVAALVREHDFGEARNAAIYATLVEMDSLGASIDTMTVRDALDAKGKLQSVGGLARIAQLDDAAPNAANAVAYAKAVRIRADRRRLGGVGATLVAKAAAGTTAPVELAQEAQRSIDDAVTSANQGGLESASEVMERTLDLLDRMRAAGGRVTGTPTGFIDLDSMTTGMHPGDLLVLAARPGVGKTALGMNIASHVAVQERKSVAVFSLEMPSEQLMLRLISAEGRVPLTYLRGGGLSDYHQGKVADAASAIIGAPLHIDSTATTLFEIRNRCRRQVQRTGPLSLIVIDYLQLMVGAGRHGSREQEVAHNSRGLKQLAKELSCPVLALAQLNRKSEERKERPRLSDLRESGAIEQDADVVLFIHPDAGEGSDQGAGVAELVIAKQRNGPVGSVSLTLLAEYTKFETRSRQ